MATGLLKGGRQNEEECPSARAGQAWRWFWAMRMRRKIDMVGNEGS
jgi:hypothetical protein